MAQDPSLAYRPAASPTGTDRTSSALGRRWASLRSDEEPQTKDKAYKRYASGVERSLSLFDTTLQEWADYISFLGRLLKSLQAHPSNIKLVPSKSIVAKCLAQCLNPSLPSGVHQKTLELYNYIFSMIGKESLSYDLPLYLPGLSSTLSFASLSVRSPFLALLEKHLVTLDAEALRPALKSIILALLPGLEDETSEDFDRTLALLNAFRAGARTSQEDDVGSQQNSGDEYFWQCFFLASITSNSRRPGALAYLVRNLPKLGHPIRRGSVVSDLDEESNAIIEQSSHSVTSPEPGLLLRCFAAGLEDDQILIQRGFLDLLVTHLPLHSQVLQKSTKTEDLELLLTAAAGVVARRDMSLNRRLWAWLLGPEPDHDAGPESPTAIGSDAGGSYIGASRTSYFEEFGLWPLTRSILKLVNQNQVHPAERAKPFRICLSLMDRWEIGGLVVPEIFLPVIDSVKRYESEAPSKNDFNEVLRSASVFFDGVESGLIWGEINTLIAGAVQSGKLSYTDRSAKLSLASFIISHFNVREEEMLMVHAPLSSLMTICLLAESLATKGASSSSNVGKDSEQLSRSALEIALNLIDLIPERAFSSKESTETSRKTMVAEFTTIREEDILKRIQAFYAEDQGNLDSTEAPFTADEVGQLLLWEASNIVGACFSQDDLSADVAMKTRILVNLAAKVPHVDIMGQSTLIKSMRDTLSSPNRLPFAYFSALVSLVAMLYHGSYMSLEEVSSLIDPLVRKAWPFLSGTQPKYHVETVRLLWQLQHSLSMENREIEASICEIMTENDVSGTFARRDADSGRSFSVLWTHTLQDNAGHSDRRSSKTSNGDSAAHTTSMGDYQVMLGRPTFLFLDALADERTQLFSTARTWLQGMVGIEKLFYMFVVKFSEFPLLQTATIEGDEEATVAQYDLDHNDVDQCIYYLDTLSNILRWASDFTWTGLAESSISTDKSYGALYRITGHDDELSLQVFFVHVCLRAIAYGRGHQQVETLQINQLRRTALSVLQQILLGPYSLPLAEMQLEHPLLEELSLSLQNTDSSIQVSLLDAILAALKIRQVAAAKASVPTIKGHKRGFSNDNTQDRRVSTANDRGETIAQGPPPPPPALIKTLQAGFAAPSSRPVLDSWIVFLSECLPYYSETLFQILLPLVGTLCEQIRKTFEELEATFLKTDVERGNAVAPESTLISLLNGLEQILARGHDKLLSEEARAPVMKTPDQPQGFFGNMVSGVFNSELPQSRTATANKRLTILLTFQDAVRMCFMIWSWGGKGPDSSSQDPESVSSFGYTSLRMRNRARRLLEHLFAAETLECLETIVSIWQQALKTNEDLEQTAVLNLLHVLDGSRPKHTIPAIFNAIYSRTNPNALDPSRKSTLTSELADTDLVIFLVKYAKSLEDDAMDEIWVDCMTFLRDILANPFPHRQTLPSLLEFAAMLGEKVDNTNFGEQRKMRRELADLFLRLLTALFTTKPIGFSESQVNLAEKAIDGDGPLAKQVSKSDDVVGILASIVPNLPKILLETDRILNAANVISSSVIGPTFRSKYFPENVTKSTLSLLYQLARLPNTQKSWRKDIGEAFNDPRFFANSLELVQSDWLPLLRQWTLSDRDRMPELLSRLTPPSTAGIVFGVGATSARLEADRKTQLNLRRIATLILAAADDVFVSELKLLEEKVIELLSATSTSSPSSTTRADIYLVFRALALKTTPIHLAFLWPVLTAELQVAIGSVIAPDHSTAAETYNNMTVLQACKLLDTLLCVAPDDFQLHEWLFVTDTIDAVYRPADFKPTGLIDELAEELGSASSLQTPVQSHQESMFNHVGGGAGGKRRPLLGRGGISHEVNLERKDELVGKVLRPFFAQLSIYTFETTYGMGSADVEACRADLLRDVFDEASVVKAL